MKRRGEIERDARRNGTLSRRNFLKAGGFALGGLPIFTTHIWRASGQDVSRTRETTLSLPNAASKTAANGGKICVIGLTLDAGSNPPQAVKAKIYDDSDAATTVGNTPAGDATTGTRYGTTQVAEGVYYNFHFVGDEAIPGATASTDPTGNSANYLVIWVDYTSPLGNNFVKQPITQLTCVALPFTDCEAGWYDTFEHSEEDDFLDYHNDMYTPGGYEPEENFDEVWKVVAGQKAAGNIGPNSTAVLMFDPGLSAFVATHMVGLPGAPAQDPPWQMWALRSVRHQDSDNRWQWQIGHYYDGASYKFHELVESVGGNSTQRDFATIDFTIGNEYPCRISIDDDDVIKATFDTSVGGANSELVFQSEELSGETTQALNTYYDADAQPDALTRFDKIEVKRLDSFTSKGRAAVPAVAVNAAESATVLCKLEGGKAAKGPKGASRDAIWRPPALNPGGKGFVKGVAWRWTDLTRVEAPQGGGKQPVAVFRIEGADLKTALEVLHKVKQSYFVLSYSKGAPFNTVLEKADVATLTNLLRRGGYESDFLKEKCARATAAAAVLKETQAKCEYRKFQRWAAGHKGQIDRVAEQVDAEIAALPGPFEPEKRRAALRRIHNLSRRREILAQQRLRALQVLGSPPQKPQACP